MSVSEKLPTYPSPNPTFTLTCYQLIVVGLGEGYRCRCTDADVDPINVYSISTEFFLFFTIYNFLVWTVSRGLQGKDSLFVCISWIMHALDNLIFRERKTVWMDWHLLLCKSWKVLRERRPRIWFKDLVEKLPNQWPRKQVILSRDRILGRVNFLRYIVMHSSKQGEKNCEHKHISCTFFPKFL